MIYQFKRFVPLALAMVAFAANSLLCRAALSEGEMDAWVFTQIRLFSGAMFLNAWLWISKTGPGKEKRYAFKSPRPWMTAMALFVYALGFSLSYRQLDTGTGALILFGSVQLTMFSGAYFLGNRPNRGQIVGMGIAFCGLIWLFLPGVSAPSVTGGVTMAVAGAAWGVYSVAGPGDENPITATTVNFTLALVLVFLFKTLGVGMGILSMDIIHGEFSPKGVYLALASGILASGAGYVIWYKALETMDAARAGVVQLSVPILAFAGGIFFLSEPVTLRFMTAAILVLSGIGLSLGSDEK